MYKAKGLILVVDDEQSIREIIARKLRSQFYYCLTAADGQEALDKALLHDFDVVLLDIRMPGMSGMEVLPKLVARHPSTAVIMVTAVPEIERIGEAIALGAYDYVTKPLNLNDLCMRVAKAVASSKLLSEKNKIVDPKSTFSSTVRKAATKYVDASGTRK